MRKKVLPYSLLLTMITAPVLTGCVVTPQDMKSLNLRLRSIDTRLEVVEEDMKEIKEGTGASVEIMQKQQAGIGNTIDQLHSELLQVRSELDESQHRYRSLQAENERLQEEINNRFLTMENQTISLHKQIGEVGADLQAVDQGLQNIKMARVQEATAKADAAARAAASAREQAEAARKKSETHEIVPQKSKKTLEEEVGKQQAPQQAASTKSPPKVSDPEQQAYDAAMSSFKAKKYKESYNQFNEFIAKYGKSPLAVNARFWSGDCLFNQNEYALAILEYQNVIADYPHHEKAAAALYKQALAFERLQDNETAKIVYKKIISEYPKSEQAGNAGDRLKELGQ